MSTPTPPPPPPVEPPPMQPPMAPPPGPNRADMLSKVKGPALAMMIIAGITFVLEILSILANLLGISILSAGDMSQFEGMEGMEWLAPLMSGTFTVVMGVFTLVGAALIFYGAMKMKDLQGYGLAMTAAILSLIPCFSICCIGIPFGIWALVVLLNQDVKSAFG
ncbi:MAG: hypothetical protein KAJ78_09700 [Acidobacteria bacterium]|nr:hypothetical protein [Acidobacteriota bacterium]